MTILTNEIVKVTAISGNTLTVVRAQEGTTARAFSTSNTIEARLTAGIMNLFPQLDGGTLTADSDTIAEGSSNLYYTDARAQAVSINNVVEDTTPQLGGDLASNGSDILFADNDKAIFGAGSDLQIYHDGSTSFIKDAGTGNLTINATNFVVNNAADSHNMIIAIDGGASKLYHAGSLKLETTSGGVDITGTLTATTLAGTLSTAAQTNITSVGTLTSLNTSGDVTMTSTDTGSSAGPIINLVRDSASPADADYLGQIKFKGENDNGASTVYSKITGKIDDASNGSEDGIIEFAAQKAGSSTILARLKSSALKLLNGTIFEGDLTGNVTGNVSGTAATVTTAAQPNITSLGTLTTLTVDDITIDGSKISVADNSATALTISEGSNDYLTFDTTDSAEKILVGKPIDMNGNALIFDVDGDTQIAGSPIDDMLIFKSGGTSWLLASASVGLSPNVAFPLGNSTYPFTHLYVDNINVDGNTIKSTDSDGDLLFRGNDGGSEYHSPYP